MPGGRRDGRWTAHCDPVLGGRPVGPVGGGLRWVLQLHDEGGATLQIQAQLQFALRISLQTMKDCASSVILVLRQAILREILADVVGPNRFL